ncbi:hypothetical protein HID58_090104 [Brassica napus]|uniref:Uncharacterized protein n=1 Tax=Brassica napus TaxID=3708 RepID=A0ABQ7XEE9_BRANA|nr:hypothetical protein HID58_090104 [Brassica napus]
MYHLKWLDLNSCEKLRSLSTLPPNLQWLDAHGCISLQTVSSPLAFIVPTEQIHNTFTFSFTKCCKLNEAAKNEIASHVRRKCQLVSSDDHHNGNFISTCYPGYEVPAWFSHQAYGSVDQSSRILAKCTCEFEDLDAPCSRFSIPVENEPRNIDLVYEPDDEVSNVVSLPAARTMLNGESSQGEVTTFQSAEEGPTASPTTATSTTADSTVRTIVSRVDYQIGTPDDFNLFLYSCYVCY